MTAKRKSAAKRKPAKPAEAELRPHKIVGQLIGARFNEHGDIVGEQVMGEVAIFRPNFGKVPQLVEKAIEESKVEHSNE